MDLKKLRRKVRRFVRRHRHHLLLFLLLLVCGLVLTLLLTPQEPDHRADGYEGFLADLGFRESSNDYTGVNRFGYMGRYQMGELALREAGFMDKDGAWTDRAHSYGVYSRQDFLNTPEAQDAAVRIFHEKTCRYIRDMGLENYVGSTYCGVTVTESGLLAACHLVGIGGVRKGLRNGQHVYDGNHVSAAEYMELFGGYDISSIWPE